LEEKSLSLPNIPNITPSITVTRNDAINLLLSSIAMEELGHSHIMNAEGEKLQFALGTLPGVTAPLATISDIINVNASIQRTVKAISQKEFLMKNKLDSVLTALNVMRQTEATGAARPTAGNSAHIFSDDTQTPPAGGWLVLSNNGVITGTDITHVPGSPDIVLAGGHTFLVTYMANTLNTTGGHTLVNLNLNGSPVSGSGTGTDASNTVVLTATCIVSTPSGSPSVLNMVSGSAGTLFRPLNPPNQVAISITISEVA
jgi:hypothetical protein